MLTYLVVADKTLAAAAKSGSWKPDVTFLADVSGYEAAAVKADPNHAAVTFTETTRKVLMTDAALQTLAPNDQQAILTGVKEPDVVISPRYGTFDPAQGLVPVTPNWMVKPAATGAPQQ